VEKKKQKASPAHRRNRAMLQAPAGNLSEVKKENKRGQGRSALCGVNTIPTNVIVGVETHKKQAGRNVFRMIKGLAENVGKRKDTHIHWDQKKGGGASRRLTLAQRKGEKELRKARAHRGGKIGDVRERGGPPTDGFGKGRSLKRTREDSKKLPDS